MKIFKNNKTYKFMELRKIFLSLSIVMILLSFTSLYFKGLNYGVDFIGGSVVQLQYSENAPIKDIRNILSKNDEFKKPSVTKFGSDKEVIIKFTTSSSSLNNDIGDTINEILKPTGDFKIRRVDVVGPKVGSELRNKGIISLILSLITILIYVSFRFEWKFALASIFALFHDVIITVGFISFFSITVNLDILAAILTLIGYSLNDTIIVFDRIRENIFVSKTKDIINLINESVSKTLSRTTLTSLTTFFVVLTLWMFGGEIIHGFGFTLLVGIMIGTYSSIFIASTFLSVLKFSISDYRNNEARKEKLRKEKEKLREEFEGGII